MTSLLSWVAVDSHGPTSLYMCSDSRISWPNGSGWNNGRKVFATRSAGEVFGYCGDVVFPSLFLAQVVEMIDAGLVSSSADPATWSEKVACLAHRAFVSYPASQRNPFTIVHCFRRGTNMSARFFAFEYRWNDLGWSLSSLKIPADRSDIVTVLGSGASFIEKWHDRWGKTKQGRTSRAVFGAFCDSLNSQEDQRSDGTPQLVAIHRSYPAKTYGMIWKGNRYLLGLPVENAVTHGGIDWRNALLERCDGETMAVLPQAKQHRQPKGLARALRPARTI
jgi:hypothetical protein